MTPHSNPFLRPRVTLIVAALATGSAVFAAAMSPSEYSNEKAHLATVYKSDKSACSDFSSNQKDICFEKAAGKDKVARAELEYQFTGKPADRTKVATAKADAEFALAKERCDDKSGHPKDVCRQEAKAAHTKALADAKLQSKVADAQMQASDDKRDADYKVATAKCDAFAGDPKTACVNDAKARFSKR